MQKSDTSADKRKLVQDCLSERKEWSVHEVYKTFAIMFLCFVPSLVKLVQCDAELNQTKTKVSNSLWFGLGR